jgi:N-acetylmuramoyl-L-alanine amidase
MDKLRPILDTGHGGVIGSVYQTAGKRSPRWSRGILWEGMFNRWVVNRLIEKLDRVSIPYYHVSPEFTDTPLQTRVKRANSIYSKNKNTYLLSIHANAGGGQGIEGFTTIGKTGADPIADKFLNNLELDMSNQRVRFDYTDGDRDKETNYYILRNASAPAFLLECGFMDNVNDYNNLWDEDYLSCLVDSLFRTIEDLYDG